MIHIMKRVIPVLLAVLLCLAGCTAEEKMAYRQISQEEAKSMMTRDDGYIIVDVRRQDEYDSGHIPGAVLLPVGSITEAVASSVIPDYDTIIMVYCRSGKRSLTASRALAALGYCNVYEFGGINTWPYEIE